MGNTAPEVPAAKSNVEDCHWSADRNLLLEKKYKRGPEHRLVRIYNQIQICLIELYSKCQNEF